MVRLATNFGFPPEYEAAVTSWGEFPLNPGSPSVGHRAIAERQIVHIPDVAVVPGYSEISVKLGKQRTSLGVPLLQDSEAIGLIMLARQRVETFSDRQIELVSAFADQVVIAIKNTRLLTEQREALEQQTATAEVLQVINATPGDLAPVFDAMLDKATGLCEAAFGAMMIHEGDDWHRPVAIRGLTPERVRDWGQDPLYLGPGTPSYRLVRGERLVHVQNATEEEAYRSGNPYWRDLIEVDGVLTWLAVPLRKDGVLLGTLIAYRREVRPFSDKQIGLLENFAAQAVIAMENARLLTEQQEALEQQTATAEVLQVINSPPGNLAPVFGAMLEKAMRLCGAAIGGIYSYDGQEFATVALLGVTPAFREYNDKYPMRRVVPGSLPARMIEAKGPVQHPDVMDGEMYRAGSPYARALAELGGIRAALDVPLLKEETLLGFIAIYREEPGKFSDKQIALLENFAAQAVIAMENARLLTEQREALDRQTATADVLQVIDASPGNLAPVFDTMLDKAMLLCGAAIGLLYTNDGRELRLVAQRGVPAAFAKYRAEHPLQPHSFGAIKRLYATKAGVQVLDLAAAYSDGPPIPIVELGLARTLLMVPLLKDTEAVGHIALYRQEVRAFSEKQVNLLESFAAQAVIAMENACLIAEQHEALEQQIATAEVLRVINSSPGDRAPVFDAILDKAHALCGVTVGSLTIYKDGFFHTLATHGFPEPVASLMRQPLPPTRISQELIDGARFRQIEDIRATDLNLEYPVLSALVEHTDVRTSLLLPLRKDGALLGTISVNRAEVRPFSEKEIALLENFAAQAVIAMENARLLNEIRQRQAELHTTFDNMGDGVAMFDAELRLTAWNRNFQRIIDLPDPVLAARPRYADYLRLLAERGEFGTTDVEAELSRRTGDTDKELRLERVRPDGRGIEVRRNAVPSGGFVLIYSDITERKRSEEAIRTARDSAEAAYRDLKAARANLIQAEKMASLGQLTAGIAHEIKNPLNFVNNFAELSGDLLDELHDAVAGNRQAEIDELTATLKGNLAKIAEHGGRADGIVRSMLEHSRGSSGERRPVNVNTLVDEALNLAYHGARAQDQSFNVTLQRDFDQAITPITLAPQDVTRVLLNLFSNGFYAARRRQGMEEAGFEPTLSVATRELGDAVEIRVRDNGIGIPEEVKDKLFQPFFTIKPTGEGTGLGLSISYDIVTQQHGGTITVDSKVGEYSEFTIRLPCNP
jgi:GAF domain-containing protein